MRIKTKFGAYEFKDDASTQKVEPTIGDFAQLKNAISGNLELFVTNEDLLKGCAYIKLRQFGPKETLKLSKQQHDLLNEYLKDCKRANYGPDIDEAVTTNPVPLFNNRPAGKP